MAESMNFLFVGVGGQGVLTASDIAAQVVAETVVDGTLEEAGNKAFRPLFNYISGANRSKEKVAMTAPVTVSPTSSSARAMPKSANNTRSGPPPSVDSRKLAGLTSRCTTWW